MSSQKHGPRARSRTDHWGRTAYHYARGKKKILEVFQKCPDGERSQSIGWYMYVHFCGGICIRGQMVQRLKQLIAWSTLLQDVFRSGHWCQLQVLLFHVFIESIHCPAGFACVTALHALACY